MHSAQMMEQSLRVMSPTSLWPVMSSCVVRPAGQLWFNALMLSLAICRLP